MLPCRGPRSKAVTRSVASAAAVAPAGVAAAEPAGAAARIRAAGLPTVIIQEGGYLSEDLTHNLANFLRGWIGTA